MNSSAHIRAICFDWGGTLMSEAGPDDTPMALWPEVSVIAGASECLAELHGLVPLAIATNAAVSDRPMIERALDRVGLLSYFSEIFCFTELGWRKNQVEFWHAVERKLGVPLANIAMIGDSIEHDVLAPASFGVNSVWLNEGGRHPAPSTPVPTVTDLRQFAAMVRGAL